VGASRLWWKRFVEKVSFEHKKTHASYQNVSLYGVKRCGTSSPLERFRRDANSLLLYCDNCQPNCRLDTYTAQNRSRTDRQYADTHTQKAIHTCDKAIMRRFPVPTIIRIEFFSSISSGPFIRAGALLYRFRSAACRGRFCTHRNVHCAPDNRRQTFENCSAWRGDIGRGALPFLIHICRASYMRARPSVVTRSAL